MLADYHVHTRLCHHAAGEVADYLRVAAAAGLDELGFSDHTPWPAGYDPQWRMAVAEFPQYREWIRELQASPGPVRVRYGLETDWVPGRMAEVRAQLATEPFDYLIGSVHYTDELPFDDPEHAWRWQAPEQIEQVWQRYAELMLEMVRDGGCDILGHFDLPKKFGWRPAVPETFLGAADEILREAGARGMAIEINTAGLRKPVHELYPALALLKLAVRHGLGLTLGSDAHAPGEVAADFPRALDLARAAGFQNLRTYCRRQFTEHRI